VQPSSASFNAPTRVLTNTAHFVMLRELITILEGNYVKESMRLAQSENTPKLAKNNHFGVERRRRRDEPEDHLQCGVGQWLSSPFSLQ
jgi:hypothetical protein